MGDATGVWWVNALSCARRRGLTRKDQDGTRLCDVISGFMKLQQAHIYATRIWWWEACLLFDYFLVIMALSFSSFLEYHEISNVHLLRPVLLNLGLIKMPQLINIRRLTRRNTLR